MTSLVMGYQFLGALQVYTHGRSQDTDFVYINYKMNENYKFSKKPQSPCERLLIVTLGQK